MLGHFCVEFPDFQVNRQLHSFEERESTKIKMRKVASRMFLALCSVGLLWQQYLILHSYFRYEVTATTSVAIPQVIFPLALSFCVAYDDVLDYDALNRDTGRNWSYSNRDCLEYTNYLTIEQLFRYSPQTQSILEMYRYLKKGDFIHTEAHSNFSDHVNVTKYYYKGMFCYHLIPHHDKVMTHRDVSVLALLGGVITSINFQKLWKTEYLKIAMDHKNRIPLRGLQATHWMFRHYDAENDSGDINMFFSHYFTMDVDSLPPPYETNCRNYSQLGLNEVRNEAECIEYCVTKNTVNEFGKIPHNVVVTNVSSTMYLLSNHDLNNITIDRRFREIQENCSKACSEPACQDSQVITVTYYKSWPNKYIKWKSIVPSLPSFKIVYRKAQSWIDLIIYLTSSISTWTGFSIFAMDPIRGWRMFVKAFRGKKNSVQVKTSGAAPITLYIKNEINKTISAIINRHLNHLYQRLEICEHKQCRHEK